MDLSNSPQKRRLGQIRAALAVALMLLVVGAFVGLFILTQRAGGPGRPASRREAKTAERPYVPPADAGYVGSAACAAAYQSHPMSRSIGPIGPAEVQSTHSPHTRVAGKQRVLDVEFLPDALVHHERMFDDAGEPIYDFAVVMDYVMGSGRRGKSYFYRRGSVLCMSPLSWYTQSQSWDRSPGYAPDDARRFDRRINDECLSCHAGRAEQEGRSLNRFSAAVFREAAIGCENCHGPGERHVTFRESGVQGRQEDDPIVNPARLDPERRESVCYQCHLQAAVRVLRAGRSEFDFRPGRNVEDIWTYLDKAQTVADDGTTKAVSHVQQMRASRCFKQSDGRFGCTSCHDPHRAAAAAEHDAFYRKKCAQCHHEAACSLPQEQRRAQNDSCIRCHMPAREANNVAHVTQTDHRVLRAPPADSGTSDEPPTDELNILRIAGQELTSWEQRRALALGAWLYLVRKGRLPPQDLAPALKAVLEQSPDDGPVLAALGTLSSEYRLDRESREYLERARQIPDAEETALLGLLALYHRAGEGAKALECADRLLQIDPGMPRGHALRAEILFRDGRITEAIDAANQALNRNPAHVATRQLLADAYRAAGHVDEQREQERILQRIRNARPPAR
jgi:tetratricopeptide (TPR) repeat protein